MQTFSKAKPVDFAQVPLFLECEQDADQAMLMELASSLSPWVRYADGNQRTALHLAAVFACNFANRCYDIAAQILEQHDLDFKVMLPLIDETARKVHEIHPQQAQTGPAKRWDKNVMDKHLSMLDAEMQHIYQTMSQSIHNRQKDD